MNKEDILSCVYFEVIGLNSGGYYDEIGVDFSVNIKIVDDSDDADEEKLIGKMKSTLFFASSANEIYEQLDNHTIDFNKIAQEHFDEDMEDYVCFWEEYEYEKFMAIRTIEIDEKYRGKGILNLLINWLNSMFRMPMILEAYPLQYSYDKEKVIPRKGFSAAQNKVIKAYLKCGFKRTSPKSIILYYEP
jgi:N-acetylglutamate synthase-like GNAT family acetyltransferase